MRVVYPGVPERRHWTFENLFLYRILSGHDGQTGGMQRLQTVRLRVPRRRHYRVQIGRVDNV